MIDPNSPAWSVIAALVSLLGFVVFYFWLWRPYRVDYLRDRLFMLRDELFEVGLSPDLSFEHPAYGMLRSVINGTIRHAHRVELLDILVYVALSRRDKESFEVVRNYEERWSAALATLPLDVQTKLKTIRRRMHLYVVDQLVFLSPPLLLTVLPAIGWLLIIHLGVDAYQFCRRMIGSALLNSIANQFDSAALEGSSTVSA